MKKGFTLIELLAVIVILAIIALIVTPVVSNIVTNARIAANARSVEGHIRNIEIAIISRAFSSESTGDTDAFDNITSGTVIEASLSIPDNDVVTCKSYSIKHGTVLNASGCKDSGNKWGETYKYSNEIGAYAFSFKGTVLLAGLDDSGNPTMNVMSSTLSLPMADSEGNKIVTYLGIVYMDPSNIRVECNANSTITTGNTGCKKFYIYKDTGTEYVMIMDRNTTSSIKWNDKENYIAYCVANYNMTAENCEDLWDRGSTNGGGNKTAMDRLDIDTTGWIGSPKIITKTEI